MLRKLLETETDAIDRHFMLTELSRCLYKSRDAFASALDEFDEVCEQHHSEIAVIRGALVEKFGCVPVIDLYRQASIRCQKARNWTGTRRWAQRGLAVYGDAAARPEVVVDLQKRLAHAEAKAAPSLAVASPTTTVPTPRLSTIETLTCLACGRAFERERTRGRKPRRCPTCRDREASGSADDLRAG